MDNENLVNAEQNLINKLKSLKKAHNVCSKDLKTKESLVSTIMESSFSFTKCEKCDFCINQFIVKDFWRLAS